MGHSLAPQKIIEEEDWCLIILDENSNRVIFVPNLFKIIY